MPDMEATLEGILSNPDTMQKIMAIAQNLNQPGAPAGETAASSPPAQEVMSPAPRPSPQPSLPQGFDLSMLQKLSGLQNSSIDKNQRTLLNALGPYLSRQRISKLEKAMQAAKMAQMASSVLGFSQSNSGR